MAQTEHNGSLIDRKIDGLRKGCRNEIVGSELRSMNTITNLNRK